MTINTFIIEDQKLIIEAYKSLLLNSMNVKVIGSATTQLEAIEKCRKHKPDVVLMDIGLKDTTGIELTKLLLNIIPNLKVLGLSMHTELLYVKQLLKAGAKGYLTKNVSIAELTKAIEIVYYGGNYVCEEIKDREFFLSIHEAGTQRDLTDRELIIIKEIAKGKTSREIGEELSISKRTVDAHRYNIMKKVKASNLAELILWTKENKYI
jgi:DNA-binding NarL/FixJ family response regulator